MEEIKTSRDDHNFIPASYNCPHCSNQLDYLLCDVVDFRQGKFVCPDGFIQNCQPEDGMDGHVQRDYKFFCYCCGEEIKISHKKAKRVLKP